MLGGPHMHCVLVHSTHIPATLTHLRPNHDSSSLSKRMRLMLHSHNRASSQIGCSACIVCTIVPLRLMGMQLPKMEKALTAKALGLLVLKALESTAPVTIFRRITRPLLCPVACAVTKYACIPCAGTTCKSKIALEVSVQRELTCHHLPRQWQSMSCSQNKVVKAFPDAVYMAHQCEVNCAVMKGIRSIPGS